MLRRGCAILMALIASASSAPAFQLSPASTQTDMAERASAEIAEAHEQWLAGVAKAAARFGCDADLIQQQPNETVAEVLNLYSLTAKKGTCLVLLPISPEPGDMRYSYASGGKIDGTEIFYISDVPKVRIRNGAATGD